MTLRSRLRDAIVSARLIRALARGEVEVFYQPIYHVRGHRLAGFEALARWRRSTGELLSPSAFVPAAEGTGAITRLDEYVLRRAVAAARTWPQRGRRVFISVNLSAATLTQPGLVAMVDRILDEGDLPPETLQVEITESTLIMDLPAASRHVDALRARGVRVAIDDFGSGHASLNYLRRLLVDVVKVDRGFVAPLMTDERSRRLLEGVTHLCDLLALQVIAEGVESPEQYAYVDRIGIGMAQGFLLGRPASTAEAGALLNLAASLAPVPQPPQPRRACRVPSVGRTTDALEPAVESW